MTSSMWKSHFISNDLSCSLSVCYVPDPWHMLSYLAFTVVTVVQLSIGDPVAPLL